MAKQKASFHEDFKRDEHVEGGSDRSFGLVFTVVFAIIGLWPLIWGADVRWWAMGVAAVFAVVTGVRPVLLAPLNKLWTRFGLLLSKVVSPIVLGLLYFVAVVPTGLIMRMRGHDLLRLKLDPDEESYWIKRDPPGPPPGSLSNQF